MIVSNPYSLFMVYFQFDKPISRVILLKLHYILILMVYGEKKADKV